MALTRRNLAYAAGMAALIGVAGWNLAMSDEASSAVITGIPMLDKKPAYADLEHELPAPAVRLARTDSILEEENSRPIEQVMKVDKGDTLMDLLLRAGVERGEAITAIDALRKVYNPRNLRAGQEITVSFTRTADGLGTGEFNGISLEPQAGVEVTSARAEDGFAAKEIKHETSKQLARFSGTISSSLFETASGLGLPAPVVVEMIRAMSYDVDFQRDIRGGDSFEVLFERYYDSKGKLVRDGELLYANMTLSGKPITIYRYEDSSGLADYFTADGKSVRKGLLKTPVDGARISSRYGMRKHPVLGYNKMHKGVDFAVQIGTPVFAAGSGVVEKAGRFGAYGYYVRVRHSDKYSTAYAHLSRFAQGVRAGSRVKQGQVIAYSGNTGRSTGPHLHYEVLAGGKQVNPLGVKFDSGTRLAGNELKRFKTALVETEKKLARTPAATQVASK